MGGGGEKGLACNESFVYAKTNNLFKDILEQLCAAEFTAAKLRKGEMVGHSFIEIDDQEPAVCNIGLHFLLQSTLRVDSV